MGREEARWKDELKNGETSQNGTFNSDPHGLRFFNTKEKGGSENRLRHSR